MHEPDWESLNEINFLLYNRFADPLNAALSAIELSEQPELSGYSPQWWRDRSKSKIASIISLVMAWSWLIQYKNGMAIPKQAVRPFSLQETLDWLAQRLKIDTKPTTNATNILLKANQETFQEALLMLHNVAASQGSHVNVVWQKNDDGVRFAIQFKRRRSVKPFDSLEDLINSFKSHWRSQLTAFELGIARSFLQLNEIHLEFSDTGKLGEFSFTITKAVNAGRPSPLMLRLSTNGGNIDTQTSTQPEGTLLPERMSRDEVVRHFQLSADNATLVLEPVIVEPAPPSDAPPQSMTLTEDTPPTSTFKKQTSSLPEWRSLMEYDEVDWNTLGFINRHTYHRLTNPLIKALGHIDSARYGDSKDHSLDAAQYHLEIMITSMKAWGALTRWKNTGEASFEKLPIFAQDFPRWFKESIMQKASLEIAHTVPIHVHQDAFYEGILLLVDVAYYIGKLKQVTFKNAKNDKGIWIQVVFLPPLKKFYKSKLDVLDSFIRSNPMGEDLAVQFSVADDLFKLNGTHFTLQENVRTGEQAFAIFVPTVIIEKKVDKAATVEIPALQITDDSEA